MATLTLWESFSKRENSTKTPTTAGTEKNVKLKENVSVSSPIFIINEVNTLYSYAKFDDRYYFVNDIVIINSTQSEIHCLLDVLGTYKTDILLTSAFVKYHSHNNTEITDARLSTKTTKEYLLSEGAFDTLGTVTPQNSALVIAVTGEGNNGCYAISQDDVNDLIDTGMADIWQNAVTQINFPDIQHGTDVISWLIQLGFVLQRFFNSILLQTVYSGSAMENIKSAHLLPLTVGNVGSSQTQRIKLGRFDTGVDGYKIPDRIFSDSATVNIPWQANDWRRNAPYHEIFLYIPYIGLVQLSASDLINETTISVAVSIDKFSGDAIFTVTTGNGIKIGQYATNLASSYPIGISNVSAGKASGGLITAGLGAVSALAGIASGGATMALTGAVGAGVGLVNAITPNATTISGASGGAVIGLSDKSKVKCYSIFHDTTVSPATMSATFGTPTNAVLSLSTITGYVQTVGASVDGDMELSEKQKINSMLDSGIYIE